MQQINVIEVRNVKKKFKVYFDKGSSLKEKILFQSRNRYEDRWVLKGISFSVKQGEAIGLIGKNGCGKSTTLKLLSRIMYPNEGEIEIKGRVSSLLELGAGFHPDMSGRENIYTNASIFGLTRKEIDMRMHDIISFSELEEFLDNPVRTYSSGMYMRLAFSVAINVDADVLLIDEILAVGDVSFQAKCFEKLKEIKANGTTIVIVSHSMGQIEQICDRTIWLDEGLIKEEGIPKFVGEHYLNVMEKKRLEKIEKKYLEDLKNGNNEANNEYQKKEQLEKIETIKLNTRDELSSLFCGPRAIRTGNKKVFFTDFKIFNEEREAKIIFETGKPMIFEMHYKSIELNLKGTFSVEVFRDDGVYCFGTNTYIEHGIIMEIKEKGKISMIVKKNCLLTGKYLIHIGVHNEKAEVYDYICNIIEIQIKSAKGNLGICRIDNFWTVDNERIKIIDN